MVMEKEEGGMLRGWIPQRSDTDEHPFINSNILYLTEQQISSSSSSSSSSSLSNINNMNNVVNREMTFIDPEGRPPTNGMIIGFILLAALALFASIRACMLGQMRKHYRSVPSVRFLFPLACHIVMLENITLAVTRPFWGDNIDDHPWIRFIFILQAFEVPILLVVTFELTYLIHKRRSVNFCGMYFDEGKRIQTSLNVKSFLLRNFFRILAVFLLTMGIVVNLDLLNDYVTVDKLAGRTGWWALFDDSWNWQARTHVFLGLLPTAVLVVCCFYLSTVLWGYGTNSSMEVHSSILNPWFSLFFGTVLLTMSQFFSEKWYPLMSNGGFLILIISIIFLMFEIDKDMAGAEEFSEFLDAVKKVGDEITVKHAMESEGVYNNNRDSIDSILGVGGRNGGGGGGGVASGTDNSSILMETVDHHHHHNYRPGKLYSSQSSGGGGGAGSSIVSSIGDSRRKRQGEEEEEDDGRDHHPHHGVSPSFASSLATPGKEENTIVSDHHHNDDYDGEFIRESVSPRLGSLSTM